MVKSLTTSDPVMNEIARVLQQYEVDNPGAEVMIARSNLGSIRMQVVNPRFRGKSLGERHDHVAAFLDHLANEDFQQISMLQCLAPGEEVIVSLVDGVSLVGTVTSGLANEAS